MKTLTQLLNFKYRNKPVRAITPFVLALLFFGTGPLAHAAWSPYSIPNKKQIRIAHANDGNVHLVWIDSSNPRRLEHWIQGAGGLVSYRGDIEVPLGQEIRRLFPIAVDRSGQVHVLFETIQGFTSQLNYSRLADGILVDQQQVCPRSRDGACGGGIVGAAAPWVDEVGNVYVAATFRADAIVGVSSVQLFRIAKGLKAIVALVSEDLQSVPDFNQLALSQIGDRLFIAVTVDQGSRAFTFGYAPPLPRHHFSEWRTPLWASVEGGPLLIEGLVPRGRRGILLYGVLAGSEGGFSIVRHRLQRLNESGSPVSPAVEIGLSHHAYDPRFSDRVAGLGFSQTQPTHYSWAWIDEARPRAGETQSVLRHQELSGRDQASMGPVEEVTRQSVRDRSGNPLAAVGISLLFGASNQPWIALGYFLKNESRIIQPAPESPVFWFEKVLP